MRIELERAHAPRRCAFCHDDLPPDDLHEAERVEAERPGARRPGEPARTRRAPMRERVQACLGCGARLHAACLRELGRCPSAGCAGRADALVPAHAAPRLGAGLAPWGEAPPVDPSLGAPVAAGAAPGAPAATAATFGTAATEDGSAEGTPSRAPSPIATPWAAFVADAAPWAELGLALDAAAWAEPGVGQAAGARPARGRRARRASRLPPRAVRASSSGSSATSASSAA